MAELNRRQLIIGAAASAAVSPERVMARVDPEHGMVTVSPNPFTVSGLCQLGWVGDDDSFQPVAGAMTTYAFYGESGLWESDPYELLLTPYQSGWISHERITITNPDAMIPPMIVKVTDRRHYYDGLAEVRVVGSSFRIMADEPQP